MIGTSPVTMQEFRVVYQQIFTVVDREQQTRSAGVMFLDIIKAVGAAAHLPVAPSTQNLSLEKMHKKEFYQAVQNSRNALSPINMTKSGLIIKASDSEILEMFSLLKYAGHIAKLSNMQYVTRAWDILARHGINRKHAENVHEWQPGNTPGYNRHPH